MECSAEAVRASRRREVRGRADMVGGGWWRPALCSVSMV